MTTKQFGQTAAFLVGIFMVAGLGIGIMSAPLTQSPSDPVVKMEVVKMEERVGEDLLTGKRLFAPVIELQDFVDTKKEISFSYPKAFYKQKTADGKYAYQIYFTSSDIRNDFRRLGDQDVQLTVTVFKKGWIDGKNVQELAKQGVVNIEEETAILVDGISAIQERVLVLTEDPGCDVRTYFTKSNVAYELSLFSPGKSCETVQKFMTEYSGVLNSFRIGKQVTREE